MQGHYGLHALHRRQAVNAEVKDEGVGVLEVLAHRRVEGDEACGEVGAGGYGGGLVEARLVAGIGVCGSSRRG